MRVELCAHIECIATIGLLDKYVVIGKAGNDCSIFFYGSDSENGMILITAMDGFYEALKLILKWVLFCLQQRLETS